MQYKQLKLCALIIISGGVASLAGAQQSISSAGGTGSGIGGSASYTIGQVVYQTYFGPDASVAEGVQQPFEILGTTSTGNTEGISLSAMLFPNPVSEVLQLQVEHETMQDLHYQLFDAQGSVLQAAQIEDHHTSITMLGLPASSYFLRIFKGKKEMKTFKIIKN